MFCGNCGTPNMDGAKFCCECGCPLPVVTPEPTDTFAHSTVSWEEKAAGFVQNWRIFARSVMVLLLAIAATALLFLRFASFIDSMEGIEYLSGMHMLSVINWLSNVIVYIALLLSVVGLWLLFAEGFRKRALEIRTVSVSLIRAGVIIMIVSSALVAFDVVYGLVENARSGSRYMSEGDVIWTLFATTIGGALPIVTYALVSNCVSRCAEAAKTKTPVSGPFTGAAIMMFLCFTVLAIGCLLSEWLTIAEMIELIALGLGGVVLITYGCKMKNAAREFPQ